MARYLASCAPKASSALANPALPARGRGPRRIARSSAATAAFPGFRLHVRALRPRRPAAAAPAQLRHDLRALRDTRRAGLPLQRALLLIVGLAGLAAAGVVGAYLCFPARRLPHRPLPRPRQRRQLQGPQYARGLRQRRPFRHRPRARASEASASRRPRRLIFAVAGGGAGERCSPSFSSASSASSFFAASSAPCSPRTSSSSSASSRAIRAANLHPYGLLASVIARQGHERPRSWLRRLVAVVAGFQHGRAALAHQAPRGNGGVGSVMEKPGTGGALREGLIMLFRRGTGGHLFPAEALAEELLKRGEHTVRHRHRQSAAMPSRAISAMPCPSIRPRTAHLQGRRRRQDPPARWTSSPASSSRCCC